MTTITTINSLQFIIRFINGIEIFTPLFATGLQVGEKAIFDGCTSIKETVFDENTEEWVEAIRDYNGVIRQINSDDMIQYKCCIEYYNFKMECHKRDYFGFDGATSFDGCDVIVVVTENFGGGTTATALINSGNAAAVVDSHLQSIKSGYNAVRSEMSEKAAIQAANEKAATQAAEDEFIFSDADKTKVLDFLKSNKANAKQIQQKAGISCTSFETLQGLKTLAKKGILKEDCGKFYI